MATAPQILLMDDPLSNIDPPNRLRMRGEILKFHQENRLTTIYVTHNVADGIALADRIAVMRNGRFEQVDTAENQTFFEPNRLSINRSSPNVL